MAQFPSTTSAYGVWSLNEIRNAVRGGNWPIVSIPTDDLFSSVSLLLHGDGTNGSQNNTFLDSSSNNFTITRNGNTTQGSYSPYGDRWSNYFDGAGDYLSYSAGNEIGFGTGDFTVEFWAYIKAFNSTYTKIIDPRNATIWVAQFESTTNQVFQWFNGSSVLSSPDISGFLNQWFHLAVAREGGTLRVFINGDLVDTVADTTNYTQSSGDVYISRRYNQSSEYLDGYLSDLRIVKGTAVYTANFTPPTEPLTAVSGTSLLTCQSNRFKDNSSNDFAITVNGNTKVTPFSPYAPSAAYDPATGGGSGYFDGTGDYITFTSPFSGTGDFTAEAWVYKESLSAAKVVIATSRNSSPTSGFLLSIDATTGNPYLFSYVAGSRILTATTGITTNSWNHIAAVRQSGTVTMYVNGVASGTGADTSNYTTSTNGAVGATSDGAAPFDGYISDARVVTSAVYTSNFTPPTAPLTAVSGTEFLCSFTNAGIFDSTGKNVLETVGNAQIDTAVTKFGTGSMEFNGTTDYLLTPDTTDFGFGTADFTFEFWMYQRNAGTDVIIDFRNGAGVGPLIYTGSSRNLYYFASGSNRIVTAGSVFNLNEWTHVALVRSNNVSQFYVNGVATGSSFADTIDHGTSKFLSIGAAHTFSQYYYDGFLDDIRITKGVARYTTNFTPPTAAFPDQ